MANTVDKVINIALAEVGYTEKNSNADIYRNDKAGNKNYTKYGKEMHDIYPSVMDYPAYWCDAFVDWCFYKAYGVATAKSLIGGNFDDYTVASAQMYKNKKAWYTSNPKVGDQVFFKNSTRICHTGIVYKVTKTYIYTIEGNTSSSDGVVANGGCVAKKKYKLTDSSIAGYGRPKYDVVKEVKTAKVDSAKSFSKSVAGTYRATTDLNLRCGAGTSKSIVTVIKAGKSVNCYGYYTPVNGTKWLLLKYGDHNGFASSKYLQKL
jgi:hypothetical protein